MKITRITIKQASHYLLLCVIMIMGLSSCHEDVIGEMETTTNTQQPDIKQVTQGDLAGYIYDENNEPVAGAEVTLLGRTTQTNEHGVYVFRNATLDANGTYIKATKQGYLLGSDKIYPNGSSENYSYIKLLRLTTDQSFSASEGGTIPVQGGGSVVFASASIVDNNGASYMGNVFITAKRIAANDSDIQDVMPGALVAEDNEGYTRVLGTFGMVAVELRDANGNELNLADGSKAIVSFPITENMQSTAPEQIELWSFDEDKGLWIEDGFAIKDGSNYIGEVSHFSFWNCDAPFPLIHVCGKVQYANGEVASNLVVNVNANVSWGTGYGVTDGNGVFCGKMPKGEELTITIFFQGCNQNGHTFTVGPFESDTDLGVITIPNNLNQTLVTGSVVCNGEAISNASIVVQVGEITRVILADENGEFSYSNLMFGCNDIQEGSIFALNNDTGEASPITTYNTEENVLLVLNTCSDCNLNISIEIESTDPCDVESYSLMAVVTGGSGTYEYQWSSGSNDQTISNYSNGLNCVTVTDIANDCEEIICQNISIYSLSDSTYVMPAGCGDNNGSIIAFPFGGTSPYTIEVKDENNMTVSTSEETKDLAPGVYTIYITDANNCTITSTQTITEIGISNPIVSMDCQYGTIYFVQDFGFPYMITWNTGEVFTNQVSDLLPGIYCFSVENNQGCTEDFCVTIETPFEAPPEVIFVTCDYPNWIINFGNSYIGTYIGNNNISNFQLSNFIEINPLQFGYYGELQLFSNFENCDFFESITLPSFQGLLTTDAVSATCPTCNDGYIVIDITNPLDCFDCIVGNTAIYAIEDTSLSVDFSQDNQSQSLPSGAYYVVVKDLESGCIIAHELVEL